MPGVRLAVLTDIVCSLRKRATQWEVDKIIAKQKPGWNTHRPAEAANTGIIRILGHAVAFPGLANHKTGNNPAID